MRERMCSGVSETKLHARYGLFSIAADGQLEPVRKLDVVPALKIHDLMGMVSLR